MLTELRRIELTGTLDGNNSYYLPPDLALGAGGVFTGDPTNILDVGTIIISCKFDVASATDGLDLQFANDPAGPWDSGDVYTIGAGRFKTFSFQPALPWMRVVYTNGAAPQTSGYLVTQSRQAAVKASSHRVQDSISDEDDATLTKAVLSARQADATYDNVGMDTTGSLNIAFGDGANLDAFSRLRISDPDTVFDATMEYDLQPLIYEPVVSGTATVVHSPNDAAARLSVVGAGDRALIQSRQYHRYIPGKGQLALCTGNFEQHVAGNVKRVGYYDDDDGVFYEQDAAGVLNMVIRSSTSGVPVETRVPQSSWNIDPLDGTGRSAITLDPTKVYILVIEMQWLGMGRVRVGFDIDGRIYMVHQFLHANVDTTVYMKTANLPNRWEIDGDSADSMLSTCCSVQSEGGADKFLGYEFAVPSGVQTAPNGARGIMIALRPAATFNGLTNRMLIQLKELATLQTSNGIIYWELIYNPTLTAPAWVAADATYSGVEYDISSTAVAGGIVVHSYYTQATNQQKQALGRELITRYPLVLDAVGAQYGTWALTGTGVGGAETGYATFDWEEVR